MSGSSAIRDFGALAKSVQGCCFPDVLERLYREARDAKGDVVEFGTKRGRSAIAFAWGIQDREDASASRAYLHTHDPCSSQPEEVERITGQILKNFVDHDARQVCFHAIRSQDVPSMPFINVDLVFIDGDHSYEGCRHDLDWALRVMERGGVVIVDDVETPGFPGIDRALMEVRFESNRLTEKWRVKGDPEVGKAPVVAFEVAPA